MDRQTSEQRKVLYIAGSGRSGTTILGNVLAQIDGVVSVGELYLTWEYALTRPNVCGCGEPVPACPFWVEVFDRAYGGLHGFDEREILQLIRKRARTRHFPERVIRGRSVTRRRDDQQLKANLQKLYAAVAAVSGCQVIVDTSKRPVYGRLLAEITELDTYELHLIRDPRAVAYSWSRHKIDPETGRQAVRMGTLESSAQWMALNLVSEVMLRGLGRSERYLRIRYEDFASQPVPAMAAVLEMLDLREPASVFVDGNRVEMEVSHTIGGNRCRYETGLVTIEPDLKWKAGMDGVRMALVAGLTWPLMRRYGYPFRVG